MENKEDILDALTEYGKSPPETEIPAILDQYLVSVAKNGETLFQWSLLKPLIVGKMERVIEELRQGLSSEAIPPRPNVENVRFDVMHSRIIEALHKFNGAPFTIQRLCELLNEPKRHYKRSDKLMRGLEKNVLVVSTVDPFGRKVVSESSHKPLVNGMDMNGGPFGSRSPHSSTPLPPVPGWVTSPVAAAAQSTHASSQQEPSSALEIASNGVSPGLANSVYTDAAGDTPLAVHAEEVVEETVVTMEAHEVPGVAMDGGESLAEEEITTEATSLAAQALGHEGGVSGAKVSSSCESPHSWPHLNSDTGSHSPRDETDMPDPPDPHPSPSRSPKSDPNPHTESPRPAAVLSWHNLTSDPSTSPDAYLADGVPTSTSVADTVTVSSCDPEDRVSSHLDGSILPPGPLGPEPCDSVAGLERLVDSVDPSPQAKIPPTSSPGKHPAPAASAGGSIPSQSCDSPTSLGEPEAKRCKLSENSDAPSNISSVEHLHSSEAQDSLQSEDVADSMKSVDNREDGLNDKNNSDSMDSDTNNSNIEHVDSTGADPLTNTVAKPDLNNDTVANDAESNTIVSEINRNEKDQIVTDTAENIVSEGAAVDAETDSYDQTLSSTSSSSPKTSSPPSHRVSSDSTGFEVTNEVSNEISDVTNGTTNDVASEENDETTYESTSEEQNEMTKDITSKVTSDCASDSSNNSLDKSETKPEESSEEAMEQA